MGNPKHKFPGHLLLCTSFPDPTTSQPKSPCACSPGLLQLAQQEAPLAHVKGPRVRFLLLPMLSPQALPLPTSVPSLGNLWAQAATHQILKEPLCPEAAPHRALLSLPHHILPGLSFS